MAGFSSALKLTDLNDFIAPSQECIKPITSKVPKVIKKGEIQVEGSESLQKLEKVKITLNDCLACSGCITSAEVVLVNEQSVDQLMKVLEENKERDESNKLVVVLSVSCQSILSIGLKNKLQPDEALTKVVGFFKSLGVDYVFDINFAKCFSVIEAQNEFIQRYKYQDNDKQLPMLASACPGFVCYVEKTHGPLLLPNLSRVRSPQQIMGALIKKHWASKLGLNYNKIYHVSLMPCFDKKLEASREEFLIPGTGIREVDCVITTVELEDLLNKQEINLKNIQGMVLDSDLSMTSNLSTLDGSGSGGYAHHIFLHAASQLFNCSSTDLQWKVMRNNDMQELTLEIEGETKLRFALAYGFKNIQNLVKKIKRKKCTYDYVEVMACPSGCLNGGAQSRPNAGETNKDVIVATEELFKNLTKISIENAKFKQLYCEWLGTTDDQSVTENLYTTYKMIEKNVNPLGIKW